MSGRLDGKRVAILVTDGFEQVEMTEPRKALEDAGVRTDLVSPARGKVKGWQHTKWGDEFPVDVPLSHVNADDYDALVLPGGVANPDALRVDEDAVGFVTGFFEEGKPVAVICHGPWTLVEGDLVRGRTLTSWPSLKTDIVNAGGEWVDEEVHVDGGLVTSRKPDDLPAFCATLVEEFAAGPHERQTASITA